MHRYWYLDGHTAVPTDDIAKWGASFENGEALTVAREDDIDGVCVSTVFLGINHRFDRDAIQIFETMVFRGPLDERVWRYATWDEAEAGHARIVAAVRGGYDPDLAAADALDEAMG